MSLVLNKLISFINLGRFCNFNLRQQSDTVQIKTTDIKSFLTKATDNNLRCLFFLWTDMLHAERPQMF